MSSLQFPPATAQVRRGLARANGLELYYEDLGDPAAPAVLLIMGLGAQHVYWPETVVTGMLARGYRVVRFDNRDIGLSSKLDAHAGCDALPAAFLKQTLGRRIGAPYTLYDMAEDTVGLLDALGIDAAHLVGVSMGGMIAQLTAALHRERVRSLTSIMSSTLHPRLPRPRLPVLLQLSARARAGNAGRAAFVDHTARVYRAIHGRGLPFNEARVREIAGLAYDRCHHPPGFARQAVAVLATGCFEPLLGRVRAPALVVHGDQDPLVHLSGGQATARAIRGARLEIVRGMGHGFADAAVEPMLDWTDALMRSA